MGYEILLAQGQNSSEKTKIFLGKGPIKPRGLFYKTSSNKISSTNAEKYVHDKIPTPTRKNLANHISIHYKKLQHICQ